MNLSLSLCRNLSPLLCAALALVWFPISDAKAQSIVRGPYLQLGTPTSMIVRWRTDVPSETRLEYSLSPDALTSDSKNSGVSSISGLKQSGPTTEHEVLISGLAPQTRYYYRVLSKDRVIAGGDLEHYFVTSPLGGDEPVRIWAVGDAGISARIPSGEDPGQAAVRDAFLKMYPIGSFHFFMMLGDNAYYTGSDDEYQRGVFNPYRNVLRSAVTWSTQGNHDYSARAYYPVFSFPTRGESGGIPSGTEYYYSFDHGNVHFIVLNSEVKDNSFRASMVSWLRQDLAANNKDWTVALWHHPPYSKGQHDSDKESTSEGRVVWMRTNIVPILEAAGVDLVLSGHSHSYERSKFLSGHYGLSSALSERDVVVPGDGHDDQGRPYTKPQMKPLPHSGTVFVVAGSSGEVLPSPLNHPAMVVSLHKLGSMYLDFDVNELNAKMIGADGSLEDYFTIRKDPARPRAVQGFTATADEKACRVRVRWQADAKHTGYTVYRSSTAEQRGKMIGTVSSGVDTFEDVIHTAEQGNELYYSVRASNSAGQGPWGSATRVVVPANTTCR